MRAIIIVPVALALSLAACKKAEAPKTEAQVSEAAAQIAKPQAGQYRMTSKLVTFEVPGMPAAQQERFRQMFATAAQGSEYCLTPEQAEMGFQEAMKKLPQGKCTYDKFNVDGSKLDAQLSCETGKGMKAQIGMNGRVTTTGSNMEMTVNQAAPAGVPTGGIKMVMQVETTRIGDCKAN